MTWGNRSLVQIMLVLSLAMGLVSGVFVSRLFSASAPTLDLAASRILTGLVTTDQQSVQLFLRLRTILVNSPERYRAEEIVFLENMIFLAAADFSLIRAVGPEGRVRFPLRITPTEFRLSMMKYDTAEGNSCMTPIRILRERRITANDLFLFSGDSAKFTAVDPNFTLRSDLSANAFNRKYEGLVDLAITGSARSPLTEPMRVNDFSRFEAVLLWAKLQFVTQQNERDIASRAPEVLRLYGFR